MHVLKLIQIGNSIGVILPKDVLAALKLTKGESIFLTETPDGYAVTPHDPVFEQQMTEAQRVMKKRRAVLHELAK